MTSNIMIIIFLIKLILFRFISAFSLSFFWLVAEINTHLTNRKSFFMKDQKDIDVKHYLLSCSILYRRRQTYFLNCPP
jgi:hypothetical protein